MARIAGVDLPRNKRIEIALTYIYGIGALGGQCDPAQRPRSIRAQKTDDLTDDEVDAHPSQMIDASYKVEGDLRREVAMNIKRLMDLGCYRGLRHRRDLPVRGQRTHTNARTRKGPRRDHRRQEAGAVEGLRAGSAERRRTLAKQQDADGARAPSREAHGATQEGEAHRREGVVAHPFDRSTTRSSRSPTCRATCSPGRAPGAVGLQGLAQGHAVRGAGGGRGRARKAADGLRACATCRCFVKGPGAGRESALRALQAAGFTITHDPRRHADPAQRLPAAEAPAGLRSALRGTIHRSRSAGCAGARALKLFLKGERCYTDKCAIERRNYPPGRARPGAAEVLRVRAPAAREAEAQPHVRRARAAVPPLLRDGRPRQGRHRRDPAAAARAAARQRGLPPRLRDLARRGAAARAARPLPGQRAQGRTSRRTWSAPATSVSVRERSRKVARIQEALELAQRRGVPDWLEVDTARRSPARVKALPARADLTMPINEKLIVELYSK